MNSLHNIFNAHTINSLHKRIGGLILMDFGQILLISIDFNGCSLMLMGFDLSPFLFPSLGGMRHLTLRILHCHLSYGHI